MEPRPAAGATPSTRWIAAAAAAVQMVWTVGAAEGDVVEPAEPLDDADVDVAAPEPLADRNAEAAPPQPEITAAASNAQVSSAGR